MNSNSPDTGRHNVPEEYLKPWATWESSGEGVTLNRHPDAQWFPDAGLGLFIHMGIASVAGGELGWSMIKDYPHLGDSRLHPPAKYYALADEWHPDKYDPDILIEAAARAGFTYAAMVTKHIDGYTMWPSNYGEIGTKKYLDGRDLVRPFIEACRKYGLKAGLYFAVSDWSYPGYPIADVDFDYNKRWQFPRIDVETEKRRFDEFYKFTMDQIEELLTSYGKIDLFWFDGWVWPTLPSRELLNRETLGRIRELQPGIVINDRWNGAGDYYTPECVLPSHRPDAWWESCHSWFDQWGYNPNLPYKPNSWVLECLVKARSMGGNFLLNIGPAPDGTVPSVYFERCAELEEWMSHSRESLIGAGCIGDSAACSVPVTRRENTWYLHLLPDFNGEIVLKVSETPVSAVLLNTGKPVSYNRDGDAITFLVPQAHRTNLDDVICLKWSSEPKLLSGETGTKLVVDRLY